MGRQSPGRGRHPARSGAAAERVLGGEEPIDHLQKQFLRSGSEQHPAMSSIMQIHVAEEARHIGFAHQLLEHKIPTRGPVPRFLLSLALPLVMRILLGAIMVPPKQFWDTFDIPRSVKKVRRQADIRRACSVTSW